MSDGSHIEWTDATWNVVTGCTRVSSGCEHCYIERTPPFRMARRRFDKPGIGGSTGVTLHSDRLGQPYRWRKPRRVFVCSLADLFHADVPDEYIADVWAVMARNQRHVFQVLTKRHARLRTLLSSVAFRRAVGLAIVRHEGASSAVVRDEDRWMQPSVWPLPNVWVGVTAEDQRTADRRVPALLATPAAVRWVSAEPMLGPIDLFGDVERPGPAIVRTGYSYPTDYGTGIEYDYNDEAGIDWTVVGCESGPGARPMDLAWAENLVKQCQDADVPVLVKQLGTGPRGWATQDITTFPASLRVREYPHAA